jgi:hypothetical protein
VSTSEELLGRKSSGSSQENRDYVLKERFGSIFHQIHGRDFEWANSVISAIIAKLII